jgi:FkbM family methyltransferase
LRQRSIERIVDVLRHGGGIGQGLGPTSELLGEIRARLINVELKINALREGSADRFSGHPDQAFGHLSYAQHGEDMIVVNIFHLIGIGTPTFLDVGAHHPINISNTALLSQRGSKGINIEANPNLIQEFKRLRPNDINLNCGVGPRPGHLEFYYIDDWSGRNTFDKAQAEAFVGQHPEFRIRKVEKIEVKTLDQIIAEFAQGRWPDFLTIDVEGWDFAVMEASGMRCGNGPKVVCVEVVTAGSSDSSQDVTSLLRERGYRPYARTIGNVIFIDTEIERRLQR